MDNLQMLTQTWSGPLVVALQILLILLVAWLLQRLVRRTVTRIGERYPVPPELLLPLRGGLRWLIMVSALIMVLERLGVSAEVLWTALTGFAAVAAVAFFAIWSVLSNLFCALLIFTVGPFRIGDRVELIDSADKPGVTGRVVASISCIRHWKKPSRMARRARCCRFPTACSSRKPCVAGVGQVFQLQQKTGNNHLWNGSPVLKSGSRS